MYWHSTAEDHGTIAKNSLIECLRLLVFDRNNVPRFINRFWMLDSFASSHKKRFSESFSIKLFFAGAFVRMPFFPKPLLNDSKSGSEWINASSSGERNNIPRHSSSTYNNPKNINPKLQTWWTICFLDLLIWQDPVELRAVALVAWMPTKDVSVFEDTYPSEAPNSTFIRGTMLNPCWAKIVASKLTDAFSRTCTPCVFFCYELIRILNFKCGQISISSINKMYDTGRNYFLFRC